MNTPLLEIRNLKKSFGSLEVLKGIDLTVDVGEVIFLIGPSGGGKSTFARCINFLEKPTCGDVIFSGQVMCQDRNGGHYKAPEKLVRLARGDMPMVFQHFNLFAHRTALENVIEAPIWVQGRNRSEAIEDALRLLGEVGLRDKADYYPAQLSGGQKQRVAIARALAMHPKLILFDEPTSALDPELVAGILETIRSLADKGMTLIVVTHEMGFARKLADTVHFFSDGRILESGPPDRIFDHPETDRLSEFIRSILR
ncbi:amino acid ABC transporter ATP-binding protein [Pararhizobium sp. YC-54]|uniref:amino acid ABC transporter ATP-binding protein n=1 Tax=Pararhizobium sp. YC-54 TaxID=2986920 RepID=UPI0021F6FFA4|nr:amino acid ABC transporter ATP-binding protein [Pararhizobium sp. YC-54]MCW0001727.1 amino acid ABC transporter ATP-binding protein [Pararhizobium sp. YC-54]